MSNQFKSAFNTIYNVRIKCPLCKEEILAHAKKCPYCHADLTSAIFTKNNMWQKKARIFLVIIIGLIICTMLSNEVNIIFCLFVGLISYGLGYYMILKIQSLINAIK